MNQDNSFEEFCYKGLRKNVADAGRSIVKGGLFVCLFKLEKYQHMYCNGKDPVKCERVMVEDEEKRWSEIQGG